MTRKYYPKTPKDKYIYIYTGVFPRVSERPLIRPAKTPIYYQVKKKFEQLADGGSFREWGIEPGMSCRVVRIEETKFTDIEDPKLKERLLELDKDYDAIDRIDIPEDEIGLERFFVEEESARNEKTFKAINYSPVPLPKMTEEDFFKVMIQVNYGGLAETIHKQWIKVSKDKNVIGLKDDYLDEDKEDEWIPFFKKIKNFSKE